MKNKLLIVMKCQGQWNKTLPYKKGARQGIFASPFYFSNYVLEKCFHYKISNLSFNYSKLFFTRYQIN